ncbi:MAG: hypothetical protein VSS52_001485, partial [Thiotrichaceae bacterium]|nr:hypothetical protein [Thiotrichaceae bacterium]
MGIIQQTEAQIYQALAERLVDAKHGQTKYVIEQFAQAWNISNSTVYINLKKHAGWSSGRKKRSDSGNMAWSRTETLLFVTKLLKSQRKNGKILHSYQAVIDNLVANKEVKKVSVSTAKRCMDYYKMSPEILLQPKPHQEQKSLHPNYIFELDASICVLYYMKGSKGLHVMDEDKFYKNKPQNYTKAVNDNRVIRYLLTDHTTGAFYIEYVQASGESLEAVFNFLVNAFSQRDKFPFYGVCKILKSDKGILKKGNLVWNFLEKLEVTPYAHAAGNPRGKGQVECEHNVVERNFEALLSFVDVKDIHDLNDKAWKWMHKFNASYKFYRHGMTRYEAWMKIKPEQLRLCPPKHVCKALLSTKPVERKVKGNLKISYALKGDKTRYYKVDHVKEVCVGMKVNVTVNPYRYPNVDVEFEGITYECEPTGNDEWGFAEDAAVTGEEMKRPADTHADAVRKEMEKLAYGKDTLEEAEKAKKAGVKPLANINHMAHLEQIKVPEYKYDWDSNNNTVLRYDYEFMPKGMMTQF